jgi:hypothetical protein
VWLIEVSIESILAALQLPIYLSRKLIAKYFLLKYIFEVVIENYQEISEKIKIRSIKLKFVLKSLVHTIFHQYNSQSRLALIVWL